ncbi:MAG: 2-oxoglutarate dehydrogenase complex dihydrolipoyllysine-residue succinyltransferase [Pseudomonadota bacterium]|nr:2-oxoglutarate dehydrogenase complex dihydrolipoyllysine-residue succinyltransferase [Pseudomonadota bacterium]
MTQEIKAPQFPESISEGTILAWNKAVGESTDRDELLVEIETDKVVLEVVAPANGALTELLVEEGDTIESGQVIATFDSGADSSSEKQADTASAADKPSSDEADSSKDASETSEIKTPQFPESISEGTVLSWSKAVGESCERDELLVEIETDKVVLEVVAPANGSLSEIKFEEGDTVTSGAILGIFTTDGAAKSSNTEPTSSSDEPSADARADDEIASSPGARKLMRESGISPSEVAQGLSIDGRISKEDVQRYQSEGASEHSASQGSDYKDDVSEIDSVMNAIRPEGSAGREEKRVPMTRIRKRIASRLVEAQQTAAMLTTFNEANMQPIMDMRSKYKAAFEEAHDVKLGFMSFVVRACTEALKRYPAVNASIDGEDVIYHGYFDIGVAVSSERGLVVPIVRDANFKSLADIERNIVELGLKARNNKLSIEDITGGTFSITNGGIFGSMLSTPILNPPQTAILGMHAIQERAMAVDGEVKILPMMNLALTYDHRLIDGKDAVQFLVTVKQFIEDPSRLLLDL